LITVVNVVLAVAVGMYLEAVAVVVAEAVIETCFITVG
jgi:hypothetical protein